jgi:hypothetical protein
VLLDLAADRYFCLPAGLEAAFVRGAEGRLVAEDKPKLKLLLERGLLLEIGCGERARLPHGRQIPTPIADLFPDRGGKAKAADVMRALAFEASASWQLRTRRLLSVARETVRRANSLRVPASDTTSRLRRIVSGFAGLRLLIREADRCLVRALAVHAACCREGIPARLVLGVQLHPFQAHAWVQLDEKIVVGDFEQVRLFTPIAVLG